MKMRRTRKVSKHAPTSKTEPTVQDEAQQFVERFEAARSQLLEMQEQFDANYPEASLALEAIKVQEDAVNKAVADAKAKVAAAGTTIGEFKCTRAFSAAGYDDKKLFELLQGLEKREKLLDRLMSAGVIKGLKVDKSSGNAFAAANPKLAAPLNDAWVDKTELTPRVSVPKV